MKVFFKIYDSKMASREKLFKVATEFANQIGPDRLITLTHSEDRDNIVLTIWYFTDEPESKGKAAAAQHKDLKPTYQGVIPQKTPDTHHGMPPIPPPFTEPGS